MNTRVGWLQASVLVCTNQRVTAAACSTGFAGNTAGFAQQGQKSDILQEERKKEQQSAVPGISTTLRVRMYAPSLANSRLAKRPSMLAGDITHAHMHNGPKKAKKKAKKGQKNKQKTVPRSGSRPNTPKKQLGICVGYISAEKKRVINLTSRKKQQVATAVFLT